MKIKKTFKKGLTNVNSFAIIIIEREERKMTKRKELEKIMDELRVEQKEANADKFGFSSKGNSILTLNAQLCHYSSMYKAFYGKRYRG